jgi:Protein of unknown function (DUF3572)
VNNLLSDTHDVFNDLLIFENKHGIYCKNGLNMLSETAFSYAHSAVSFILADDPLRERFLALSGLAPDELHGRIEDTDFLASVLEFLISHDPDLIAFAQAHNFKPENVVAAWRQLGGGVGQEW